MAFLKASRLKESAYHAGSIPGSERSPGVGNDIPLLREESHGQKSLVGYSPWGRKESDPIERMSTAQHREP